MANQRQRLKAVKSAADDLLGIINDLPGIINDLLDFSKIEAGKMELDLPSSGRPGAAFSADAVGCPHARRGRLGAG
jgi:signal transduction histidine kinase